MRTGESVLPLLSEAPLTVLGFLAEASNHTLFVQVGDSGAELYGIYKPRDGERPLWDFPHGSLCHREAAAYVVSEFLGWGIVPPTVLRDGPMGEGSTQLFVPHDPSQHYFVLVEDAENRTALALMALFDLLVNNADRKASHVLLAEDGHIWGVDHGLTFHVQPKLRTVIWELGGTSLEPAWRDDLARLRTALGQAADPLTSRLAELLGVPEVEALARRAGRLIGMASLPIVDPRHRSYPWPPL